MWRIVDKQGQLHLPSRLANRHGLRAWQEGAGERASREHGRTARLDDAGERTLQCPVSPPIFTPCIEYRALRPTRYLPATHVE